MHEWQEYESRIAAQCLGLEVRSGLSLLAALHVNREHAATDLMAVESPL